MIYHLFRAIFLIPRYREYKPQPVTIKSTFRWLKQFEKKDWGLLLSFLSRIVYFSSKRTETILLDLNKQVIERLEKDGLNYKDVIYVQIHDAGSSSPVMLNLLRDGALLERRGCNFVDGKDVRKLNTLTNKLGGGAIIYIDDFSGSGNQFCDTHDFIKDYIIGNFAEYFMLPCICEESFEKVSNRGISVMSYLIHMKADRPLHSDSKLLDNNSKRRLTDLCTTIDNKGGLGYRKIASMVVFSRNTPNTVPVILRGNIGQQPYCGILPRTTDLPLN